MFLHKTFKYLIILLGIVMAVVDREKVRRRAYDDCMAGRVQW